MNFSNEKWRDSGNTSLNILYKLCPVAPKSHPNWFHSVLIDDFYFNSLQLRPLSLSRFQVNACMCARDGLFSPTTPGCPVDCGFCYIFYGPVQSMANPSPFAIEYISFWICRRFVLLHKGTFDVVAAQNIQRIFRKHRLRNTCKAFISRGKAWIWDRCWTNLFCFGWLGLFWRIYIFYDSGTKIRLRPWSMAWAGYVGFKGCCGLWLIRKGLSDLRKPHKNTFNGVKSHDLCGLFTSRSLRNIARTDCPIEHVVCQSKRRW